MLTVTENTTQQINAALFEQDQNVKNKLSTVSGVVSAVYGACEWIFNKLKESLARVATTGSYNDLTDKPTIVDTVAQNVPNAVSSNAVYGALTNVNSVIINEEKVTKTIATATDTQVTSITLGDGLFLILGRAGWTTSFNNIYNFTIGNKTARGMALNGGGTVNYLITTGNQNIPLKVYQPSGSDRVAEVFYSVLRLK